MKLIKSKLDEGDCRRRTGSFSDYSSPAKYIIRIVPMKIIYSMRTETVETSKQHEKRKQLLIPEYTSKSTVYKFLVSMRSDSLCKRRPFHTSHRNYLVQKSRSAMD